MITSLFGPRGVFMLVDPGVCGSSCTANVHEFPCKGGVIICSAAPLCSP